MCTVADDVYARGNSDISLKERSMHKRHLSRAYDEIEGLHDIYQVRWLLSCDYLSLMQLLALDVVAT